MSKKVKVIVPYDRQDEGDLSIWGVKCVLQDEGYVAELDEKDAKEMIKTGRAVEFKAAKKEKKKDADE